MNSIAGILTFCGSCVMFWTTPVFAQQGAQVPSQAAMDEMVATYCKAWGEADLDRRRKLLEKVWTPEGTYTDPQTHAEGREALLAHISGFLRKLPGARIVPTSRADFHDGVLRFTWRIISKDGTTAGEGMDFGEVTGKG